jgi:hypothetical protein
MVEIIGNMWALGILPGSVVAYFLFPDDGPFLLKLLFSFWFGFVWPISLVLFLIHKYHKR